VETGSRDLHSFIRRSTPTLIHVIHPACNLRCGDAEKPHGADVRFDDSKGETYERYQGSGPSRSRRIADAGRPTERAQALSLSNPGAAAAVQDGSTQMTTEVRWHHRRHWRHWRRRW
jgi:hypothetical protein